MVGFDTEAYNEKQRQRIREIIKPLPNPPIEEMIKASREGFLAAESSGIQIPPRCPYAPQGMYAYEDELMPLASAWYRGYWFYVYIIKNWQKLAKRN